MTSYIEWYAEPLSHGRAIMRVDVVADGKLLMSYTDGSPARMETVLAHEHRVTLGAVNTALSEDGPS